MKIEYPVDIATHDFKERTTIQMRFNDLDGFMHVNNGVQQSYFDIGRANYLQKIHGTDFHSCCEVLVVASYKTDFLAQIKLNSNIEVCTSVYSVGNKSLRMMQIIRDVDTAKIYTVSDSVMVAVNLEMQTSIPLYDTWKEEIQKIEGK